MADEIRMTLDVLLDRIIESTFGHQELVRTAIGSRPTGSKYNVDGVIQHFGERIAIVKRWQISTGSTELKLPWEVISMAHAIASNDTIDRGIIVLGGPGHANAEWFAANLTQHLHLAAMVDIVVLETATELP